MPLPSLPEPSHRLQACVIIPARDEEEGIETTLDCFANQRDVNGDPLNSERFELLLLANNCRDRTAEVARKWGESHPSIALHVVEVELSGQNACVGYARRALMDWACQRLQLSALTGGQKEEAVQAICSTDADTQVSPYWIAHTLTEMSAGAKAVGGRIFLSRNEACLNDASRRIYLMDTAYRLTAARLESLLDPSPADPWPRHFQFFGASLAICPKLYVQVGGLPQARCLEDVALERELCRHDQNIRHSPHVMVWTSARRTGRVETGLSTQLVEWSGLGHEGQWLVPSAEEISFKARLQRRLRNQWSFRQTSGEREEIDGLASALMICPVELVQRLDNAPYFGALWEWLWEQAWDQPAFRAQYPPVTVENALLQLRLMLHGVNEK